MEFSTFLMLWFLCGLIATAIIAFADYKENEYKKEYDVTIKNLAIGLLCIFFGIISFLLIFIGFLCTHSETPLFTIKIKRKEEE